MMTQPIRKVALLAHITTFHRLAWCGRDLPGACDCRSHRARRSDGPCRLSRDAHDHVVRHRPLLRRFIDNRCDRLDGYNVGSVTALLGGDEAVAHGARDSHPTSAHIAD
jgi:hypothetical protein